MAKNDMWKVGDVTIIRIVDVEIDEFPTQAMFGELSNADVSAIEWLQPHYATPQGDLKASFHAYVLDTHGVRILVDTCIGNDKPRLAPFFNHITTPFLERLAAAGLGPDDINYVLCTHMHIDHVGWNTRWDGVKWIPTFPNARYLFGRVEWDHWSGEVERARASEDPNQIETRTILADSVTPIIEAGLHDFVETDHEITAEVRLIPTPGHTPGHVSVSIASRGQKAVIAGDVVHHPIQIADPGICSNFDTDRAHAEVTRRAFIEGHGGKDVLVLGTHFARPSGGRIVRDGQAWLFAQSPDWLGD
jgi:glyoxylase-like metal-dependent hydrolase (beta-lactamase superfamily II)